MFSRLTIQQLFHILVTLLPFLLGFLAIAIIMATVICYVIAYTRNAANLAYNRPDTMDAFETALSLQAAVATIQRHVSTGPYRIHREIPEAGCLVLQDPPNWIHWGFFYPVYFYPLSNGQLQVAVGIESRLRRQRVWNPSLRERHAQCLGHAEVLDAVRWTGPARVKAGRNALTS